MVKMLCQLLLFTTFNWASENIEHTVASGGIDDRLAVR